MVKLENTAALEAAERKLLGVRLPLPAPPKIRRIVMKFIAIYVPNPLGSTKENDSRYHIYPYDFRPKRMSYQKFFPDPAKRLAIVKKDFLVMLCPIKDGFVPLPRPLEILHVDTKNRSWYIEPNPLNSTEINQTKINPTLKSELKRSVSHLALGINSLQSSLDKL